MIVCSCRAVNDATVHHTIQAGARHPDDVAERCGAGSDCGSCRTTVERMLAAASAASGSSAPAEAAA